MVGVALSGERLGRGSARPARHRGHRRPAGRTRPACAPPRGAGRGRSGASQPLPRRCRRPRHGDALDGIGVRPADGGRHRGRAGRAGGRRRRRRGRPRPDPARSTRTAAILNTGCLETGSRSVTVRLTPPAPANARLARTASASPTSPATRPTISAPSTHPPADQHVPAGDHRNRPPRAAHVTPRTSRRGSRWSTEGRPPSAPVQRIAAGAGQITEQILTGGA